MREVHFAAGQTIFSRGDPGDGIFFVTEGRIRISVLTAEGHELSFTHALPGDVIGEIAVIDRQPRSAGATALVDVHAMLLSAAATDRLMAAHPAIVRAFLHLLCARLREVSDHLETVALLPIEARVARFLLDMLARNSTGSAEEQPRIKLGMSQSEMSLLLGASRPKVNAALVALEQAHVIARAGDLLECAEMLAENAHKY
jgi:CRP/FNR family cyclic AMP-dependent transcriptional regulator